MILKMLRKHFISVNERSSSECVFVAKAIASSIETLLGSGKRLKCCESSGSSILTSSTPKILETVEIEHPAGFIINSACQSFHKEFGCGCTTLVCLVGYWASALQDVASMGVPATVIVGVLNKITEEFETVLKESRLSLKTIQDIGIGDVRFQHSKNISVQDPHELICNVFDEYVDYSEQRSNKNIVHVVEEDNFNALDHADVLTVNVTENRSPLKTNLSIPQSDFFPPNVSNIQDLNINPGNTTEKKSPPHESCTYSESKFSLLKKSFRRKESEDVFFDEFDACFDGLNLNEETPQNNKLVSKSSASFPAALKLDPLSTDDNIGKTLLSKKPSTLFGERGLANSNSETKEETYGLFHPIEAFDNSDKSGIVRSRLNVMHVKRGSSNVSTSLKDISESCKNGSELSGVSRTTSPDKYFGSELFANKKIFKKPDQKSVLLRSRHLNVSTLESPSQSQTKDYNAKGGHAKLALGDYSAEISGCCDSAISREHGGHDDKLSTFKSPKKLCKDERTYQDPHQSDKCWIDYLGHSLAHGKEHEMLLAVEILKKQFLASKQAFDEFSFLSDHISVYTVLGPPACNSCVLEGAVVELSKENQSIVASDCNTSRRIALVNGDITYNYQHPGFKDSVKVIRTLDKDYFRNSSKNVENEWIDRVMLVVKSLNLGVVAIRGRITDVLRDHLQALSVVVLENLSNHQLSILSKLTETSLVSYLLDLTAHDLGKPVVIKIWKSGWFSCIPSAKSTVAKTSMFGQVTLSSDDSTLKPTSVVYSAVLCGPVEDLVDDNELKFWNCVHRLRNALEDQCVLPGGGDIERLCVKHFEDIRDSEPQEDCSLSQLVQEDHIAFRPVIIDAICSGLRQFIAKTSFNIDVEATNQLRANSDFVTTENTRLNCDNFSCKVEAWKRAIRIVKLLLNSEYHIITGL